MKSTPQTNVVLQSLRDKGHATNLELAQQAQRVLGEIPLTTVHRITARLFKDGIIGRVPTSQDGSVIYDAKPYPHNHFTCSMCGGLRDIDLSNQVVAEIELQIGQGIEANSLVINGTCKQCKGETNAKS